eukprot:2532944-Prymnesium_polylepis.1
MPGRRRARVHACAHARGGAEDGNLQVGAAVALDDGADLLLLLVHLGQRTAVAPTPLAHRLDEQHDVGYVGVVSGRERRKVSIAPGDELLEAGRRGEDTQVGHLMVPAGRAVTSEGALCDESTCGCGVPARRRPRVFRRAAHACASTTWCSCSESRM